MFAHRFSPALVAALAFTAVLATVPVAEAARVDARKLTCQQARALVQQSGAVVMTFTNTTYDRVVRNRSFCDRGQVAKPHFTRTLDLPRCNVGGICTEDPWKDHKRWLMGN